MLTFLFDLDGVVYLGADPIPQAANAIQAVRAAGHRVVFTTNNSTRTRAQFADRLCAMHIPATIDDVINSTFATALYVRNAPRPPHNVLLVGEEGLRAEFAAAGLPTAHDPHQPIDYVVVGLDRQLTYATLAEAQSALLAGATFVATNSDPQLPSEGGRLLPGAGSIVAALAVAAQQHPVVIGKPEAHLFHIAMERVGATPATTIVVGDSLTSDILAGQRVAATTVLVLTGISSVEDIATTGIQPDIVIPTLDDLLARVTARL